MKIDEIQDIYQLLQNANIKKIFENKALLSMILETEEPNEEMLNKMMEQEDISNIFNNSSLMTEIIRIQQKLVSNEVVPPVVISLEQQQQIELKEHDLITMFVNMGYERSKIISNIAQYGNDLNKLLSVLNE